MNLVANDWIKFTLPIWSGGGVTMLGRRRVTSGQPEITGHENFTGVVEREWYDSNDRHWFSVRLDATGKLKRVQGKNLYPRIEDHKRGPDHADQAVAKTTRKLTGSK